MKPVVISRRARADLREIADFIAADDTRRALTFIADLRVRCASLSATPYKGRPAPEIEKDVRILVFGSSLIRHRVRDERIAIDRILHSARSRSKLEADE